jgi:hypothetical protein
MRLGGEGTMRGRATRLALQGALHRGGALARGRARLAAMLADRVRLRGRLARARGGAAAGG